MKILNIVGTRPNFIKMAPLMEQMLKTGDITPILLHTGQHYDENMNRVFFDQLGIPKPEVDLEVGSGTNAWQIAEIIKRFEAALDRYAPDAVLVVGDVNSTLACSLVASYHKIPVFHVEAGLRSFDRNMPEEINRILTDRLSDLLFVTEKSGMKNLITEGIDSEKVHFVGNVMVDTLLKSRVLAEKSSNILARLKLERKSYAVMTLHRPSNVDAVGPLTSILEAVAELAGEMPVVFSMHPRTEKRVREFNLEHLTEPLTLLPPQPYLDMLQLMNFAQMVLTDSGGMQEETTILAVPCLTLRENTERPITLEQGTNVLVGSDKKKILREAGNILKAGGKKGSRPELWDGCAAQRILQVISRWQSTSV
ncbi:MAG: non-hydrolyzing UDP-N-acetylglucosamine 2-epimerase [Nitrospinales bacterium]